MSVVNLVILPASVILLVVALDDVGAAVHLDFAGAQVTGEGVTVLVSGPLGGAALLLVDAALHLAGAAIAGHHLLTVGARTQHMLTEMG